MVLSRLPLWNASYFLDLEPSSWGLLLFPRSHDNTEAMFGTSTVCPQSRRGRGFEFESLICWSFLVRVRCLCFSCAGTLSWKERGF